MTKLANHVGLFLREHLPRHRYASPHTVKSYSYSFELFVVFAAKRLRTRPCLLEVEQLAVPLILDFLDSLESKRGNSIRTRNVRLAAIKSFFKYLEYRVPACLDLALQVHAIPWKQFERNLVDHLDHDEVQAILDAPNRRSRSGVRDRAMLHMAYATGVRVSELVGILCEDLGQPRLQSIHVRGKGRRNRVLPLWDETRALVRDWLAVRPNGGDANLFLNSRGRAMTRHGFAHRLALHVGAARQQRPSIADKNVSPHVLRRTCAMHTLEAVGNIGKVSAWMGHAGTQTTEVYLRADPADKLEALQARLPPKVRRGTFTNATDRLVEILREARRN